MGTWFLVTVIMSLMPGYYVNLLVFKATIPTTLPLIVNVFTFSQLQVTPTSKGVDKEMVGASPCWSKDAIPSNTLHLSCPMNQNSTEGEGIWNTIGCSLADKRIRQASVKTWNLYFISFVGSTHLK